MSRRVAALLLLLVALALQLGVGAPARRQRDRARDEFARAREEREAVRVQLQGLEQRAQAMRAPSDRTAAVRELRLALLRATDGLALDAVQIAARSGGRSAVAARGSLQAEGRQADLLRAAGRLAGPESGVLLERVTLRPTREGQLRLDLEAFSMTDSRGRAAS